MKPAMPNVLVTLVARMMMHFPGAIVRPVRTLGLRVDDPAGFSRISRHCIRLLMCQSRNERSWFHILCNVPMLLRYHLMWLLLFGFHSTAEAQVPEPLPVMQVRAKAYVRTWPDSARQVMRDSLAIARRRWTQTRPERYDFAVLNGPTMVSIVYDQRYDGHRRTMRIKGDSIVAIVFERAPQYTRRSQWSDVTVDQVLRHLEAAVADSSRQVDRLEIDPIFGYPRVWRTDDARNGYGRHISEQSDGGEVVLFRPDAKRAACRWWRRVTGRCS